MKLHVLWTGFAVIAAAAPAFGQPGPAPARDTMLAVLRQRSVHEELKLTAEQAKAVMDLDAKLRKEADDVRVDAGLAKAVERVREIERNCLEAVARVLRPEQMRRLMEISWQLDGPLTWMNDRDNIKLLRLTDVQKKAVRATRQRLRKQEEALEPLNREQPEARRKRMAQQHEFDRTARQKVLNLMTPDQRAKWALATGAPFHGEESIFDVLKEEPKK